MKTVLYINGLPYLLSDIKRNASDNIINQGRVVNGDLLMKLSATTVYAFEEHTLRYGWGDELVLRAEFTYKTYEEIQVDTNGDYNSIINAANELRNNKMTTNEPQFVKPYWCGESDDCIDYDDRGWMQPMRSWRDDTGALTGPPKCVCKQHNQGESK